jgi:hypothetical protein
MKIIFINFSEFESLFIQASILIMPKFSFAFVILILITYGCKQYDTNCSLQYVDFEKKIYTVKGCLIDSVENGNWSIYDPSGILSESGKYNKGVREGNWRYTNDKVDSIISWQRYVNKRLKLLTNIPSGFDSIASTVNNIKLSSSDTIKKVDISITVGDLPTHSITMEKYYEKVEENILRPGWLYGFTRDSFQTKNQKYYLNEYKVDTLNGKGFKVLSAYGSLPNNKFIEITSTYNADKVIVARNIFFSILSNIFLDNTRFVNPFNIVEVEKK